ncbi:tetratricopeptide repeat protein [Rhodobacteraceae bacterium KMM 6894]|nr:tetratricopeptide repeat protein [Rhodobacteraceae bacterium KMM 6894]
MTFRILTILALAAPLHFTPPAANATEAAGAYLAARQARFSNDYDAATEYYVRALAKDPSNPAILEYTVAAMVSLGRFDSAVPLARRMEEGEFRSQIAQMVLLADEVARGDYRATLARIQRERGVGPLADGLIAAWATLGEGDMAQALNLFDNVAQEAGLKSFAMYHKALALASVGDFEAADRIYSGEAGGPMQATRSGIVAWAEVLSQLERNDDAIKVLDDVFGNTQDPQLADLRARLAAGERVPFSRISSPRAGIAEVFYSLGRALLQDTGEDYVLLYSRLTEHLDENHIDARLMTAELLESMGRYKLASEAFARVPVDHPSFHAAELGRAEVLRSEGDTDAAVEVLEALRVSHPTLPQVHAAAGDLYRQLEKFDQAVAAYDVAIDLYDAQETPQWFVFYARAISHERIGSWESAEADFRRALELNPEEPQVMNYLGYSLVEKQIKLDEALDLIERAVAAQPDSGYIVDSLGWVLYRLGRYDEAIVHMERAAELMPVDPVVNDHLGDVLWSVGRFTEAEFQWKRALSFVDKDKPSQDVKPERIRRKLEVGLTQVLKDEGAVPLKVSKDDG